MAHNKYENGLRNYCLENIEEIKNNYKRIIFEVFLILLMVPGIPWFCEFINKSAIITYTAKYAGNGFNSFLFGFILVFYLIIFIGDKFYKKLLPSFISIFFSTLIFTIYLWKIREHFYIENYGFSENSNVKYLDVIWLIISLLFLKFNNYRKLNTLNSNINLIHEEVDIGFENDTLERGELADTIVRAILSTNTNRSFGIAINGPWGSGKTTFMKFIELGLKPISEKEIKTRSKTPKLLKQENEIKKDIITIWFYPWRSGGEKEIIKDFYEIFIKCIYPFDSDLSNKLKNYLKELIGLEKSIKSKIIDLFAKRFDPSFFNESSFNSSFNEINSLIRKTQKRFIIFIDDTDKLSATEVLTIFKIIRSTTDFNNVFFIIGIDREYVINSLEKSNKLVNPRGYFKKLFQLEIYLPEISIEKMISELKTKSLTVNSLTNRRKDLIDKIENLIKQSSDSDKVLKDFFIREIKNIRDIIRILNSYNTLDLIIGDYSVPIEVFILEVLKNNYPEVYKLIARKQIQTLNLDDNSDNFGYGINTNRFKSITESDLRHLQRISPYLLQILLKLYSNIENSSRSLAHQKNHLIYFHPNIFNSEISIYEFESFLNENIDNKLIRYEEWNKNNKIEKLSELLFEYQGFSDINQFFELIIIKLKFPNEKFITNIVDQFFKYTDRSRAIFLVNISDLQFTNLFTNLIDSILIKPINKLELIDQILKTIIRFGKSLVFPKEKYFEFSLNIYIGILKDTNESHQNKLGKLKHVYVDIDFVQNKRTLNQKIIEPFNNYLIENPIPYILNSLVEIHDPNNNIYTFDPYIPQIFGNNKMNDWPKNFESFLIAIQIKENIDLIEFRDFLLSKIENIKITNTLLISLTNSEVKYLNKIREKYNYLY